MVIKQRSTPLFRKDPANRWGDPVCSESRLTSQTLKSHAPQRIALWLADPKFGLTLRGQKPQQKKSAFSRVCASLKSPRVSAVLIVIAYAAGCSVTSWKSPLGRDHPLAGRIWDVSSARFIDRQSLVAQLARADFVLLGERHDNPDHHLLQAEVLRSLTGVGQRPAVGFEMFGLDDSTAIAEHLAAAPSDAAGLGGAVNWNRRGWPDWAMYQPIAEAALQVKLRIVATNLPLATARKMTRDGLAALEPRTVRDLDLDRSPSESVFAAMAADIRDSHCGYASEESVKTMVGVQRARDAQMAQSLIVAGASGGAILIAGAGHVRNDYGIPVYLRGKASVSE